MALLGCSGDLKAGVSNKWLRYAAASKWGLHVQLQLSHMISTMNGTNWFCKVSKALSLETILIVMSDFINATVHADISICKLQKQTKIHYHKEDEKPMQHNNYDDHDVHRGTFLVSQAHNLSSEFKCVAKQQQTLIICAETV